MFPLMKAAKGRNVRKKRVPLRDGPFDFFFGGGGWFFFLEPFIFFAWHPGISIVGQLTQSVSPVF